MRRKLLFGNWKMHKTRLEAKEFALQSVELSTIAKKHNVDIGVAPSYLSLTVVKENNPNILVAAQNVHFEEKGAFTGEVSIPMLLDLGVNISLVGHSERRTYFNETDLTCQKKIDALLKNKMVPLFCVGETLEEFEKGVTKKVIDTQIEVGLKNVTKEDIKNVIIAYEPVWSIGTGKNASKEIAQDICKYIRDLLNKKYGKVSEEVRILYGGSVKPNNVKDYLEMNDVDGALIGGASLTIESFKDLLLNII